MSAIAKHLRDVAVTRWKNGEGTTRELLRLDDGTDFVLRVSIADVDGDAAFSLYPCIDRTLTVLRGAGIALIDATTGVIWNTLAGRFTSLAFAGERPLEGRLIDGPILDFNVMVRRGVAKARLRIVEARQIVPASQCRLLFVAQGTVRIAFETGGALTLHESQFIEPANATHIETQAASTAFLVDFEQ